MFSEPATGSKLQVHQNGKFLRDITLNMAWLHYRISHADCSLPNPPQAPHADMDEDDDQSLPRLIGQFQKEDDADSTNSRTVVFSNIDDSPIAPPQEPNVVIPPLQTPYTGGFAPAVHYIEIENARRSVPYQTAPLAPTARCDSIAQNDNSSYQSHC